VTVFKEGSVSGFLHRPEAANGSGLVLTHGAGGNSKAPMLVTLAEAFCAAGYFVLRCDMAFRQHKPFGPPSPATSASDRASLRDAVAAMRKLATGSVVLGGHSYGGRPSTMLAAEEPGLVETLLLCSYPLHAPGKPGQPRTAHFPNLRTTALFVHGTSDPFGTVDEMTAALQLIPAKTELVVIEGAGHDLKRGKFDVKALVLDKLRALVASQTEHHA
jgi:predicted alpha/beta-hydrolase family hydrolase